MVLPDPNPEHLYSFRIQIDGEELAALEVSKEKWRASLTSIGGVWGGSGGGGTAPPDQSQSILSDL